MYCAARGKGHRAVTGIGAFAGRRELFAVDAKLPMHVIALNGAVTLVKPLGDVQEAHHLPQPTVHRITARLDEANVQYAVFGVHEVVASDDMPLSRAQVVIGTFLNRAGGRTAFRNRKQGIDAVIQDCVRWSFSRRICRCWMICVRSCAIGAPMRT